MVGFVCCVVGAGDGTRGDLVIRIIGLIICLMTVVRCRSLLLSVYNNK